MGTLTGHFSLWAKGSRVILELVFSHHACLAFSKEKKIRFMGFRLTYTQIIMELEVKYIARKVWPLA